MAQLSGGLCPLHVAQQTLQQQQIGKPAHPLRLPDVAAVEAAATIAAAVQAIAATAVEAAAAVQAVAATAVAPAASAHAEAYGDN